MKTPRVSDFDPAAKVPTLKSSLDNMPSIQKPSSITPSPTPHIPSHIPSPVEQTKTLKAINRQYSTQSKKRLYVRRTFDFFEDQIAYLIRLSLQEKLAGNEKSMNEMVREALDDWIKKTSDK